MWYCRSNKAGRDFNANEFRGCFVRSPAADMREKKIKMDFWEISQNRLHRLYTFTPGPQTVSMLDVVAQRPEDEPDFGQ